VADYSAQVPARVHVGGQGSQFGLALEDGEAVEDGLGGIGGQSDFQMLVVVVDAQCLEAFGEDLTTDRVGSPLTGTQGLEIATVELLDPLVACSYLLR